MNKEITPWKYKNNYIVHISDIPQGVIGFVYEIKFIDGSYYVGKKNLYKYLTLNKLPKKLTGIEVISEGYTRNKKYKYFIKKESDWKTYKGSCKECKKRKVLFAEILQYAYTKYQLTYLETKYLFTKEVLENKIYLNDNILGRFFRYP